MQGIQEEERETIWDNQFIGDTTNVKSDVRCRLVGKKKITKKRSYRTPGLSIPTYILFSNITLVKIQIFMQRLSYFKIIILLFLIFGFFLSKTHLLIDSL